VLQGRIRLLNGFSANCSYEFAGNGEGRLAVFSALFNDLHEGELAVMILRDGTEQKIRIDYRVGLDEAVFTTVDQPLDS
jgi:hypothetical protein